MERTTEERERMKWMKGGADEYEEKRANGEGIEGEEGAENKRKRKNSDKI